MAEQFIPPTDINDDDKLWSMLSFILAPIVPIIVLLLEDKKTRPFISYNAIQALALSAVLYTISAVLTPVVGLGCVTGVAALGYSIYLGIQAYNGETVTIPVVTDFCKKQGWIE